MLYLIHGDNTREAYDALGKIKSSLQGREIRTIDGRKVDPAAFVSALESGSLFETRTAVIIEGFLASANKREKAFASRLARIISVSKETDVILFEPKEIDKTGIAKLGSGVRITLCKFPVVIFEFLDYVRPVTDAKILSLLSRTLEHEPAEVIFALLSRRVRQLLMLKDGASPPGVSPWQVGRLTNQAGHFTMEQLISMHRDLLDAEIALKSGTTPFTMAQLLERILIRM